mmetsp:Transcript_8074/g.17376  ORF Transcript_8074/g.17376 Transcript_8074/m.17376 type:complete len:294 (+) Transcript_8074:2125-3006(+)
MKHSTDFRNPFRRCRRTPRSICTRHSSVELCLEFADGATISAAAFATIRSSCSNTELLLRSMRRSVAFGGGLWPNPRPERAVSFARFLESVRDRPNARLEVPSDCADEPSAAAGLVPVGCAGAGEFLSSSLSSDDTLDFERPKIGAKPTFFDFPRENSSSCFSSLSVDEVSLENATRLLFPCDPLETGSDNSNITTLSLCGCGEEPDDARVPLDPGSDSAPTTLLRFFAGSVREPTVAAVSVLPSGVFPKIFSGSTPASKLVRPCRICELRLLPSFDEVIACGGGDVCDEGGW